MESVKVGEKRTADVEDAVENKKPKLDQSNDLVKNLEQHLTDEKWVLALEAEFKKPYFETLCKFIDQQSFMLSFKVFPPQELIFNVFNLCPLKNIKVVIIGQDPYHGEGQAMGVSFSVPKGVRVPPSLENIYKELETDIEGFKKPGHGDLTKWVSQGVFMLNAVLTVNCGKPNSHQGKGWETFTDAVIKKICEANPFVVFMLWGQYAQKKGQGISPVKHAVLKSGHPSPLSCNRFFGCKHFSKCNTILTKKGMEAIDWNL